jgi:hypothetical protein
MARRGPAHGGRCGGGVRDAYKDDYLLLTAVAAGIEAARRGIERALDGLVDAGASTEA